MVLDFTAFCPFPFEDEIQLLAYFYVKYKHRCVVIQNSSGLTNQWSEGPHICSLVWSPSLSGNYFLNKITWKLWDNKTDFSTECQQRHDITFLAGPRKVPRIERSIGNTKIHVNALTQHMIYIKATDRPNRSSQVTSHKWKLELEPSL